MSDIMKASRPQGRSRRPKTYDEGRVCNTDGCTTVLSKYNRAEFCHRHAFGSRYPHFVTGFSRPGVDDAQTPRCVDDQSGELSRFYARRLTRFRLLYGG